MRFRRRKDTSTSGESGSAGVEEAAASGPAVDDETRVDGGGDPTGSPDEASAAPAGGEELRPRDADEVDLAGDGVERVDLGSLLLESVPGTEIRLQVSEETREVQAALIAGEDGAVELKPFAAPRGEDFWEEVRPRIAADVAQHGGTATEDQGTFGPELSCQLPVTTSEGQQAVQASRILGINGPRWLLRATFLGTPATDPEAAQAWEPVLRTVVVRRGSEAMAAGAALPIVMPPEAAEQEG